MNDDWLQSNVLNLYFATSQSFNPAPNIITF